MNIRILEAVGFALIAAMIYAMFGGGENGPIWTIFWPSAVGVIAINIYRAKKKKREKH